MITDEQYTHITVGVEDMELDAIWDYFENLTHTEEFHMATFHLLTVEKVFYGSSSG